MLLLLNYLQSKIEPFGLLIFARNFSPIQVHISCNKNTISNLTTIITKQNIYPNKDQ